MYNAKNKVVHLSKKLFTFFTTFIK